MKTERSKGQTKDDLMKQIFQLESKLHQLIEQNSRGKYFNLTNNQYIIII